MIGIYRIRNIINDKCYYGSTKNIKRRWTRHKSQLKYGRHENIILQRAWNKYGEKNFIFEIVELCELHELLIIEQKYLNQCPAYNIGKHALGGDNISKHPQKNEIIENINKSIKNKLNSLTEKEKKEKWGRIGENNPNWKGGISIKYCECGKQIAPKNKYCINCLPRNNENNPFYGRKHTNETKKMLSKLNKGKYFGKQNIKFTIDDVLYNSLGDAHIKLNIPIPTILFRLKSKSDRFNNYKYIK